MAAGRDADKAVVEVTGFSWEEFTSRLRVYALERFREIAVGREQYAHAVALLRSGPEQKAIMALQEFIERYPDSPYASTAQYYVGQIYYNDGSYERASLSSSLCSKSIAGRPVSWTNQCSSRD